MPFYDYICLNCGHRFDLFLSYAEYGQRKVVCPACKSTRLRRPIPRLRLARSDDSRAEALAGDFTDPSALAGLENDPRALGQMMRKMGREMGEEMPAEFDEVVDRLEKGQSPEEIEKEIPDLGAGEAGDEL